MLGNLFSPDDTYVFEPPPNRSITHSLRALAGPSDASRSRRSTVHYMNGLGGAGDEAQAAVRAAFVGLLNTAVEVLQTLEPAPAPSLQLAALRFCALDYAPDDHALLHDSRLLPQLQRLMGPPHPHSLRRAARAFYRLLFQRCLCGDGEGKSASSLSSSSPPPPPIPTLFQHALLNALKSEVGEIGRLAAALRLPNATTAITEQQPGCLLGRNQPLRLSPTTLGLQAPATAAPLAAKQHTLAFWLWRPPRATERPRRRRLYRVVGAEGCLVRAAPDLDSAVIGTLDTDTLVEVEDPNSAHPSHPLVRGGRRVRVVAPLRGYGSRHAAMGYQILREEAGVRPGDRVCRGPDWGEEQEDRVTHAAGDEDGALGTVVALCDWEMGEGGGLVVRWDHDPEGVGRTYRYGHMGKVGWFILGVSPHVPIHT